jgi:cytochrome P450
MLLNPDAQLRAQAEIDEVVGRDRLPTLADRARLPYLGACIKESLRWHPVGPEGMAHMSREDDVYNGYLIPKKTILIPNIWFVVLRPFLLYDSRHSVTLNRGFAHDPSTYTSPSTYCPERFLGPSPEPDPNYVFGFGRRVCPGQLLGESMMFTFAANLLALCDVERARGLDGCELGVDVEFIGMATT